MTNKYLEKLATIIDMDPSGNIHDVNDSPHLKARSDKAKLVNSKSFAAKSKRTLDRVSARHGRRLKDGLVIAGAGAAGLAVNKLLHKIKGNQTKTASDSKSDLADTATIAGVGSVAGVAGNALTKRLERGGAKLGGGASRSFSPAGLGKSVLKGLSHSIEGMKAPGAVGRAAKGLAVFGATGAVGDYAAVRMNKMRNSGRNS